MGNARFAVLYAYTVPGSYRASTCCSPSPASRSWGTIRGSRNRYMVTCSTRRSAARALHVCAPGVFGR